MHNFSREPTPTSVKPVPFDRQASLFHLPQLKSANTSSDSSNKQSKTLILPAVFTSNGTLQSLSFEDGIDRFLKVQLDVSRLNDIHQHLWMAGKPAPGRPIHQHVLYNRNIVCTEKADLHLLWEDSRLFVKPCPDYLLSYEFWERYLCHDDALWETAAGLLQSYTWLIQHKCDWAISQSEGILSESVTWEYWTAFVASLYRGIDTGGLDINPRFKYGNLRLTRVNWIYRFCSRSRRGCSVLINGYLNPYPSYRSFFIQNTAPLTAATIYFALILGAMQVGLATNRLKDSDTFQGASLFFVILAIIGPLGAVVLLVFFVMSYVFLWNLHHAAKQKRAWKADGQKIENV